MMMANPNIINIAAKASHPPKIINIKIENAKNMNNCFIISKLSLRIRRSSPINVEPGEGSFNPSFEPLVDDPPVLDPLPFELSVVVAADAVGYPFEDCSVGLFVCEFWELWGVLVGVGFPVVSGVVGCVGVFGSPVGYIV